MLIMSPEAISGRPSKGWAKHIREAKAAGTWYEENPSLRPTTLTTPQERQRRMTIAPWSAVCGFINLAIINDPSLEPLFTTRETREIVKGWFEVSRFDAIYGGSLQRDAFRERYEINSKKTRRSGPPVLEKVAPLMAVVDQAIFKTGTQPKKTS